MLALPEHVLNLPKVGTTGQQVSRKLLCNELDVINGRAVPTFVIASLQSHGGTVRI